MLRSYPLFKNLVELLSFRLVNLGMCLSSLSWMDPLLRTGCMPTGSVHLGNWVLLEVFCFACNHNQIPDKALLWQRLCLGLKKDMVLPGGKRGVGIGGSAPICLQSQSSRGWKSFPCLLSPSNSVQGTSWWDLPPTFRVSFPTSVLNLSDNMLLYRCTQRCVFRRF